MSVWTVPACNPIGPSPSSDIDFLKHGLAG